jgi:hypothetical protein
MTTGAESDRLTQRDRAIYHLAHLLMACEDMSQHCSPDFDLTVNDAVGALADALDTDLAELQDVIDGETSWECGDCGRVYDRHDIECAACREGLTA